MSSSSLSAVKERPPKKSRKEKTESTTSQQNGASASAHSHPTSAAVAAPSSSSSSSSALFSASSAAASVSNPSSTSSAALLHTPRYLHPLHRCRFQTFLPSSIISLAFSASGSHLAIGRANGNIEIWSVQANVPGNATGTFGWVLMKTIPGSGEPTVQVIKWCGSGSSERLFTSGLNGRLIEWDLQTLTPKYASDTYGGAVWCGAIFEKSASAVAAAGANGAASSSSSSLISDANIVIALGCEDGTIRLFDVTNSHEAPLYLKSISRHTSRVLSIAYSFDGTYLVSGGSDGMIKLWEIESGRNIQRITVENKGLKRTTVADALSGKKSGSNKKSRSSGGSQEDRYQTLIWSIVFLTPSTVLSGDSLGNIHIWDLEFGVLKQSFPKVLQGDILSCVVNEKKNTVYAAGVEGKIVELKCVNMQSSTNGDEEMDGSDDSSAAAESKWVLTANHRQHTHDVYALAISPNQLPQPTNKQLTTSSTASSSSSTASQQSSSTNNYLLVSGGVDTQLLLSPTLFFPQYSTISRLLPFPQNKCEIQVAEKCINTPPRFLVTHDQSLQLFGLGSIDYEAQIDKLQTKEVHVKETGKLQVEKGYVHLLDINVNSRKSMSGSSSIWLPGGGLNLVCSALSPDSSYIACSDPIQVKLYSVKNGKYPNQLNVSKVSLTDLETTIHPSSSLVFSSDSTKLFLATLTGAVQILDLQTMSVQTLEEHIPKAVYEGDLSSDEDEDDAMEDDDRVASSSSKKNKRKQQQQQQKKNKKSMKLGLLRTISISSDSQYLSIGDEYNHIFVYNLDTMKLHVTLPVFQQQHLTFDFHPTKTTQLAILCARNTLYIYDVEEQRLTDYTKSYLQSLTGGTSTTQFHLQKDQFTRLSFDKSALTNSNSIILQSINHLLHINLDLPKSSLGVTPALVSGPSGSGSTSSGVTNPHLNRRDRKRKAQAAEDAINAPAAAASSSSDDASLPPSADPLQINFRLITRFRPMLFGGFVDEASSSDVAAETAEKNRKVLKDAKAAEKKMKKKSAGQENEEEEQQQNNENMDVDTQRPVIVGSSLLVIEAPWLNILQQLPQPLARHRYGT